MRIDAVNVLIALLVCALLTYGVTTLDANVIRLATGLGSFVFLGATLAVAIGVDSGNGRAGVNLKVVSWAFFVAGLLLNLAFALLATSATGYIICCGIVFLLYVLVARSVWAATV